MKKFKFLFVLFIILLLNSCTNKGQTHECNDNLSDWIYQEEIRCDKTTLKYKKCEICDKTIQYEEAIKEHDFEEVIIQNLTCEYDEIKELICKDCDHRETVINNTTGHSFKEELLKEPNCTENGIKDVTCNKCDYYKKIVIAKYGHDYKEEIIDELTCTNDQITKFTCNTCGWIEKETVYAIGHVISDAVIIREATDTHLGIREYMCVNCDELIKQQTYVNNGYFKNGKLSVVGPDLVNQNGEKYQLFGLSTHGIQWFGRYANFETIASIQEGFGNNIIRFAFYTAENGYCEGDKAKKEQMLADLIEGVDAATKLGLYVIIDWHMVGAESVADKNPLTYLEESKEFFSYISNYYKDQDNILYEIMNEPNGSTTWADCKKYAEAVIPCIRENSEGIILVGNPKWTADLNSVMKNPLKGFTNIMYTYHFYAADHRSTTQVVNAYDSGFPVFISEFGFMDSSGDGAISETNGNRWKEVLDTRNISYVAWNISNSKGSASIFKYGSSDMVSVDDDNLKVWGVYLKYWYREKSGIDYLI